MTEHAEELRAELHAVGVAHDELVTAALDVLEQLGVDTGELTVAPGSPLGRARAEDRHAIGDRLLKALDVERDATDVDEWDESDHRCFLYNAAHFLSGRP
jgi:hypothetical protein